MGAAPVASAAPASPVVAWGLNDKGQTDVLAGLSDATTIAAGVHHSLALKADGTVVAWGWNDQGQSAVPADLKNAATAKVTAIAAGYDHSLALKADGTVVAWGYDNHGQWAVPADLKNAATAKVTAIAAGVEHSLALKADGTVVAWGDGSDVPADLKDAGTAKVIAIAAGVHHSLALKADGTVVAWGDNGSGQSAVPDGLKNAATAKVTAIAAGLDHSLALKADGTVVPWGNDNDGQWAVPADLKNAATAKVTAIAAGAQHSLALKSDGTVVAWGNDVYGRTAVPERLSGVTAIAAGGGHSLALKASTKVAAWGSNSAGQATVPEEAASGVTAIAAGSTHSLALKADGTVAAWGYDNDGQWAMPAGLSRVTAIAASINHSLALKSDGTVVAWGDNIGHQADVPGGLSGATAIAAGLYISMALKVDGTIASWGANGAQDEVPEEAASGVVAIAAGTKHSLALKADGTVVAWGDNGSGQSDVPDGLKNAATAKVTAIAAGRFLSVALKADGTVVTWGDNDSVPEGLSGVTAIAAGENQILALRADGTVVPWGDNDSVPEGLSRVTALAASSHNLVLVAGPLAVSFPDSLPDAVVGQDYPATEVASPGGGSPDYTYRVTKGSLPEGLSLNESTGKLTGMPPTVGNGPFTFTITVTDSGSGTLKDSESKEFTLQVFAKIKITSGRDLPAGTVNSPYADGSGVTLAAAGGSGSYKYSVPPGSLPAGLSLSEAGELTGTPTAATAAGGSTFTITVTDSGLGAPQQSASKEFSLTVNKAVTTTKVLPIDSPVLPGADVTLVAEVSGYNPGESVTFFDLFDGETTALGTADVNDEGRASLTWSAGSPGEHSITATYGGDPNNLESPAEAVTLQVLKQLAITSGRDLPAGTVNSPYADGNGVTLAAAGGSGPYKYSVPPGSLPAGLSLSEAGELTGTPTAATAAGGSTFTITVTDSGSGALQQSASKEFSLTVNKAVTTTKVLPIDSPVLPGADVTLVAEVSGYNPGESVTFFDLFDGETTALGTADVNDEGQASLTWSAGSPGEHSITATYGGDPNNLESSTAEAVTLQVVAPIPLTVVTTSVDAVAGQPFTAMLEASGGTPDYHWEIVEPSESATPEVVGAQAATWAAVADDGTISGTPPAGTEPGSYTVSVQATDSAVPSQQITADIAIDVHEPGTVFVSTNNLDPAVVGVAYKQTLTAEGGTAPYTWAVEGDLPAGLNLDPETGIISGTPEKAGDATFTVTATDGSEPALSGSAGLGITVTDAPPQPSITTTTLTGATTGTAYQQTLTAKGGTPPYTWEITTGALPDGLSLDTGSGNITGTPTTAGTTDFTATVTDSAGQTDTHDYTLTTSTPTTSTPTTSESPTPSPSTSDSAQVSEIPKGAPNTGLGANSSGSLPAIAALDGYHVTLPKSPAIADLSGGRQHVTAADWQRGLTSPWPAQSSSPSAPRPLDSESGECGELCSGEAFAALSMVGDPHPSPVFGAVGQPLHTPLLRTAG
ncbi:putative Ig domain-containing protein [Streptomyces sp. NBC_01017]|uniref:putative Ig domain-containing protein n=1 Tax=Streptomyces sp. NBC_01017 TaxID=2903721 RepID=UPI003865EF4D|nr:putative Ig domain-containing protein [Streptomyces sp. NBC_01017]WSV34995.1 putative Ig domain-containing protein [Streptomyces sp. NBC_01017]